METVRRSPSAVEAHLPPPDSQSRKPIGGWKAVMYILGNESFEKVASMSLIANMVVYLSTKYNLSGVFLTNVVNIWSGSTNLSSILGAIASDAYLGRYQTLLCGTICSLLGMAAMTSTAGLPLLRPPPCNHQGQCMEPHGWQLAYLFTALAFISMGAGGIRPCNIAFGADQFDTNTTKGKSQLQSFFSWWYFSFTVALILALAGVVYVQTNLSWLIGFAIPTACLALSITIFFIGRPTYVCRKPQGSVFLGLLKVITAAFWKRKTKTKSECRKGSYYDPADDMERDEALDFISDDACRCLNKAALITDPTELDSQGRAVDSWRLCSVRQVKIMKSVARIFPVWIAGVGCFLVMDQQSTFGILQALQMDRSIGANFTIPPAWMGITSMIALSIWIFIYEQIYIPLANRVLKRDPRLTMQLRITVGIIMSILCMIAAGISEMKRRSSALKRGSMNSPIHVAALLPQFALSGLTEAFAAVALMEYFTLKMPQTMRSVAGAIFFLSLSIASYLSSLIVNVMHTVTGARGGTPWLGGRDLNRNRLDHYYFLVAALGVVNLFYFTFYARKFVLPTGKCVEIGGVKLEDAGDRAGGGGDGDGERSFIPN